MKQLSLIFTVVATLLSAGDIIWQKDLKSALALAEKEYKPVMVMVEGEHCRWCKKMRYRTLDDARVVKKLSSYVNVRIDENDKAAMKLLPAIRGVPTIFFLSADRKLLQTVEGYYPVDDFLSFFKEIERQTWQLQQ